MNEKYLRPEEVSKILQITTRSLENWNNQGILKCIRTKGNHRRYLMSDVIAMSSKETQQKNKRNICYCRVSTSSQKEDLERQVEYFRCKYLDYEIVKDIGSGLNFKRKGFNSILDSAFKGDIGEIVVTHRDRLCRFGFELVLRIIESTNGKILVLDKEETSPEKELVNDILSIITVFSSRLYGLRSHSIKNKIREATSDCSENTENKTISVSGGNKETSDDV
jgi:predicted site-specific integrase-resolvase